MRVHLRHAMAALLVTMGGIVMFANEAVKQKGDSDRSSKARNAMVAKIRRYGVTNAVVLKAMTKVRRHVFIPEEHRHRANPYGDHPCPIGYGQTISQPMIVAYMTAHLPIKEGTKVLEIGTGSGYQAAILAEMGAEVYSIEIIPELAEHARKALKAEGYAQVNVLTGDGYKGWPEHAPFDAIIVTCAPDDIPKKLVDQLGDNGTMILPVGTGVQRLIIMRKTEGKIHQEADLPVRFVPMVRG